LVVNIALPRGILLRGKIVEAGTGVPVKDAQLASYSVGVEYPMFPKAAFVGSKAVTDAAGRFEVAVTAGRGGLSIWRTKEHDLRSVAWSSVKDGVPTPVPSHPESSFKVVKRPGTDAREILIEVRQLPPAKGSGDRVLHSRNRF
jgi:hypothetical protein